MLAVLFFNPCFCTCVGFFPNFRPIFTEFVRTFYILLGIVTGYEIYQRSASGGDAR